MFFNGYKELRSGWAMVICYSAVSFVQGIVLTMVQVGMLFAAGFRTLEEMLEEAMALSTNPVILLLANVITCVGCIFLFKLLYGRPLAQMGLARKERAGRLIHGLLLGIGAIGLVFLALLLTGQAEVRQVDLRAVFSGPFLLSLAMFISVGFGEELMSRGFFMTAFKTTRNQIVIVTGPALLFSLMHVANPNVTLLSLVNIFLIGIAFAYMFVRSGSLWMPIGFHITWNFFQGNILGMNVSGIETVSVVETEFTGNSLLTGGDFGAEGGLVVTAVALLCILYTRFLVKPPAAPEWTLDSDLPLTRRT